MSTMRPSKVRSNSFTIGLGYESRGEGIRVAAIRLDWSTLTFYASGGEPESRAPLAHMVPMQRVGTGKKSPIAIAC